MSAKHTPGPWFAEKSSEDFYYITGEPDTFAPALAQTWNAGRFIREQEANARLIASAPDLLEALEKIRDLAAPGQELGISEAIDLICDIYNIARSASPDLSGRG